jgi:hypothetical protein
MDGTPPTSTDSAPGKNPVIEPIEPLPWPSPLAKHSSDTITPRRALAWFVSLHAQAKEKASTTAIFQ